ncbi:MAG: hypothetical protein AABZ74_03690 [Cyanobacteriota bacterium]
MAKKTLLLLIFLLFSCSLNQNNNEYLINKKTSLLNIDNINFNFSKLEDIKLKLKLETKNKFQGGYIDNDNNLLIFLGDKIYFNNNNIIEYFNLDKKYINYTFGSFNLDKNGNGISFYYPETGNGNENVSIVKFEKFKPNDSFLISEKKYPIPKHIFNYSDYKGNAYSFFNENTELYTFKIKDFFNYSIENNFKLNNNEKFKVLISNNTSNLLVITKNENSNNIYSYKSYLLNDTNLNLNMGKIITFSESNIEGNIKGNIDENGNGYIYYFLNNKIELKKIHKYIIDSYSYFFDKINTNNIILNSKGNGFLLNIENNNEFNFYEIINYTLAEKKLSISSNGLANSSPFYCINNKGNGFVLLSSYKKNINYLDEIEYNNDLVFVSNYKIIK